MVTFKGFAGEGGLQDCLPRLSSSSPWVTLAVAEEWEENSVRWSEKEGGGLGRQPQIKLETAVVFADAKKKIKLTSQPKRFSQILRNAAQKVKKV